MAKRKNGFFGKNFNIWDLIILVLLFGLGYWIFIREGITELTNNILQGLFYGLIFGFIINFLIKRARK